MGIDEVLTRGIVNILPSQKLLKDKLVSGEKLNIYLGIDPTAPKIHLGHTVPLRKLRAFLDLGHNVTFLIGDFTTLIGDTSDKNSERPILTKEEIRENFKTYKTQAGKILDFSKVAVRYNSEWLGKLNFEEIIKLTQNFSLGDFIGRELIRERLNSGKRVRLDETLYPVMQGYDSYLMDTDIQIGAADQTFNMQAGRTLQKQLRNKESFVLVTDYLMGTDGRKMSKSWGNAIWIEDSADEMYGKVMSLKDDLIVQYFMLATDLKLEIIEEKVNEAKKNPMKAKKDLAYQIVKELHSEDKAQEAQKAFETTFQKQTPAYDEEIENKESLVETIAEAGGSKSEAKRLILGNAVDVNEKTINDPSYKTNSGDKIKVGKKKFYIVK